MDDFCLRGSAPSVAGGSGGKALGGVRFLGIYQWE